MSKNPKYIMVKDDAFEIEHEDVVLYRIVAVRSFGRVKEGELGGYIESEENLSHEGDCWVAGDAKVWGGSTVNGNAFVINNAQVFDGSHIMHNAWVMDNVNISGSWVSGDAKVYGSVEVYGSTVTDESTVSEHARVVEGSIICGQSKVRGCAYLYHTNVSNECELSGYAYLTHSIVEKDVHISGAARIYRGLIRGIDDLVTVPLLGFSSGFITIYKATNGTVKCTCTDPHIRCELDELVDQVIERFDCTGKDVKQLKAFVEFAKVRFELNHEEN